MAGLRVFCLVLLCPVLALGQVSPTICDVQEYDDQGFSPLVGDIVAVRGVVTLPPGYHVPLYSFFCIEADACGVGVFCFDSFAVEPALGDSLLVVGSVEEYIGTHGDGATTEIFVDNPANVDVISAGNPEPQAAAMDIEDIQVEDNEGRLTVPMCWCHESHGQAINGCLRQRGRYYAGRGTSITSETGQGVDNRLTRG